MNGAGARRKGHNWERDVANSINDIDASAKRMLEYQEGLGYDIDTKLPYRIQCKSSGRISWLKSLSEANGNGKHDEIPVVAGKLTFRGEFAFLRWGDFIKILKKAHMSV